MSQEQAEETRAVIEALQRIEQMEDPVARAAAISAVLRYVGEREPEWRKMRRDTVLQMRAESPPRSYRKIADLLGVSHGTVQSIERGHAGAWRTKPRTKAAKDT